MCGLYLVYRLRFHGIGASFVSPMLWQCDCPFPDMLFICVEGVLRSHCHGWKLYCRAVADGLECLS